MRVLNLGTGSGASVLDLVATFEKTCGVRVPHVIAGRRPGDVTSLVADASLVARLWGWRPRRDLAAVFADSWRFQCEYPDGFAGETSAAGSDA